MRPLCLITQWSHLWNYLLLCDCMESLALSSVIPLMPVALAWRSAPWPEMPSLCLSLSHSFLLLSFSYWSLQYFLLNSSPCSNHLGWCGSVSCPQGIHFCSCLILNLCLFGDAEQEKGEEEHFLIRGDRLLSLLVYPVTAWESCSLPSLSGCLLLEPR